MLAWAAAAVVIALLPMVFSSSLAITVLNQIAIAIVFALSYNMLLGQGGMLSFGHAAFFGLGGFSAVHLMNVMVHGHLTLPLPVVPLFGGLCGLGFAILVGSFSTRRAGTPFAMISLGIGELVAASAIILVVFFGGEEGVSSDRTAGLPVLGYRFVREIEVYWLTAAITFVSAALMYLFSRTPAGRIMNAVRDNEERAEFLGYSQRMVRLTSFVVAGFFAGVAGGLFAINYEILTEENLGLGTSGWVLLMAYVGGTGSFLGPIVGAIVLTLLRSVVSSHTEIWQLYVGLLFILTVLFLPQGLVGLVTMHGPAWRAGRLGPILRLYLSAVPALLAFLSGTVALLEIINHLDGAGVDRTAVQWLGLTIELHSPWPWLVAIGLVVVGIAGLGAAAPGLREAFGVADVAPPASLR